MAPIRTQSWRDDVVSWYSGDPKPISSVMRVAATKGIGARLPAKPKDRVRALTLTGFDDDDIVAAVPELASEHALEIAARVPGVAYSIVSMHLRGHTPLEISRDLDIGRTKVYYWLGKVGLTPHRSSSDELTASKLLAILKSFNLGTPMTVIASRYHASYDQVRYAVRNVPR